MQSPSKIRLPRKRTGLAYADSEWNAMVDCLQALMPMQALGTRLSRTALGTMLKADDSAINRIPPQARSFRLKSVQDDYVTCHYIIYTPGVGIVENTSEDIYIAKPQKLRTSLTSEVKYSVTHTYTYAAGPDSINLQRTDTWDTGSEDQLVTPPWVQDDEIIAVPCQTVVLDGSGNPITWMMIGPWRQWAEIS
jgi:hypothetical protein